MYNIHLIGAGSLGGAFAKEFTRRAASTDFPVKLFIYDDDKVERRNIFSQEFTPKDIGKTKAEVIAELCNEYEGIEAKAIVDRVTNENFAKLLSLDHQSIIVDACDNLVTRQMLWMQGMANDVPVCHASMTPTGEGNVSWNYQTTDTFPLSPLTMNSDSIEALAKQDKEKKPPCELNTFRGLIYNTSLAAVNAVFIALGKDGMKFVQVPIDPEKPEEGTENIEASGIFANFTANMTGYLFIRQLTSHVEWPKSDEELEIAKMMNELATPTTPTEATT